MPPAPNGLTVTPLHGIPSIEPGDDLAARLIDSITASGIKLSSVDVLVVAQKIVSKAEGALVDLGTVIPGEKAIEIAESVRKDARLVEVILANSRRVVRSVPGVLITETIHGFICANAGVDSSNSVSADTVVLLPADPDRSALELRRAIERETGIAPGVIISDTFNRPWRLGSINVAIGSAGFAPLLDARGSTDDSGKKLHATMVSLADEIASAAQLVMGETGGVPAAVVRGLNLEQSEEGAASLRRDPERDLFR